MKRFADYSYTSGLTATLFALGLLLGAYYNTAAQDSVTIPGDFQQELGCPGDWQPDCAVTHLTYDAEDDVWQDVFPVPAGNWQYKAAINDSWDENYGAGAVRNGPNIDLWLGADTEVKFYYDHKTHWITDNFNSVIAVAPGDFQSELGCASDWDPSCLRSWLQDPDGDGTFTFMTSRLTAGDYEVKVAHGESWDENYGQGGVQNGPNIPFTVPFDCADMLFSYEVSSHILTVGVAPPEPQPLSVTIPGSFQSELGCPGDWQPWCSITDLAFDPEDMAWQNTFTVPAGNWEYKGALNGTWDINYGLNAQQNGPNIPLALADPTSVKFYYSHETHWVTDNAGFVIATAPGDFQIELGCSGDWDPGCLRSWLQDPDGDGIFTFHTSKLPAGNYEVKVAINESWDENYGDGGVQNGANIPFFVSQSCVDVNFAYEHATHVLTVDAGVPIVVYIEIDVKPGSSTNPVNVKSKGLIPVAVLTTSVADGDPADFDATTVDVSSLAFGPGGAPAAHTNGHYEDVDLDGDLDLLVHFDTRQAAIACGDVDVGLSGTAGYGLLIEGADIITTVGCKAGKDPADAPVTYGLDQNYPNPFNPSTVIRFTLPERQHVRLTVHDMLGRLVTTLVDGTRAAGAHEAMWNATGLPSGSYIYRIEAGPFVERGRMILLR